MQIKSLLPFMALAFAAPASALTIVAEPGSNLASFSFVVDEDARTITINEVFDGDTANNVLLRFTDFDPSLAAFTVVKNVTNNTGGRLTSFGFELLRTDGSGSPDNDGLSFNQFDRPPTPRTSDRFSMVMADEEQSRDFLNFSGGTVLNGQTVQFTFGLTDRRGTSDPFFLAQNPNNTTVVPEPSTWALMILGFGMVGFASRRRSKTVSHLS
jgi:hypothetical protein